MSRYLEPFVNENARTLPQLQKIIERGVVGGGVGGESNHPQKDHKFTPHLTVAVCKSQVCLAQLLLLLLVLLLVLLLLLGDL